MLWLLPGVALRIVDCYAVAALVVAVIVGVVVAVRGARQGRFRESCCLLVVVAYVDIVGVVVVDVASASW